LTVCDAGTAFCGPDAAGKNFFNNPKARKTIRFPDRTCKRQGNGTGFGHFQEISATGRCLAWRVCEKRINFEFTLALTNVRSLAEDGIMDRMHAIRMGSPWRFTIKVRRPVIMS